MSCPCEREALASPCFSDLNENAQACLCVEFALMVGAVAPGPLPS